MKWIIDSWRLWLFRSLVAVAGGLMIASFANPWWSCHFQHWATEITPISIYSYGLRHNWVELASYIYADETPFYQTVLAWIYLSASVGLVLLSTWLRGKKGRWLLGGTGLLYIAYATIAVIWIAIRTGYFGISLQGWSTIESEGEFVSAFASLRFWYYLAHISGLMFIALALLRDRITGKPKFST